jgi:hypothetical protein
MNTTLASINAQLAQLVAQTKEITTMTTTKRRPTRVREGILDGVVVIDMAERFEAEAAEAARLDDMHDWASYDSSDIHLRTQEWEAQAAQPVIQHFVPKGKKLTITSTQREHANAALTVAMPGVQLSATLRQAKAHELLVEFLGADAANRIMAGE